MFLGQAGMFLSFQARCSSAMRSSTSDLTVLIVVVNSVPLVTSTHLPQTDSALIVEQLLLLLLLL